MPLTEFTGSFCISSGVFKSLLQSDRGIVRKSFPGALAGAVYTVTGWLFRDLIYLLPYMTFKTGRTGSVQIIHLFSDIALHSYLSIISADVFNGWSPRTADRLGTEVSDSARKGMRELKQVVCTRTVPLRHNREDGTRVWR